MRIPITKPLFAWDCLDDSPNLACIRKFLDTVPDGRLLAELREHRGKGRNDYPMHVLWGVLLLTILLRHPGVEACLADLGRNDGLRQLIGIAAEEAVPKPWNMSRFLDVLGQEPHRSNAHAIFDDMVERLGAVVPDLGRHTAGDSSGLNARRSRQGDDVPTTTAAPRPEVQADPTVSPSPTTAPPTAAAAADAAAPAAPVDKVERDRHGLPQPAGGRKEYKDDDGTVTKVVEWFGYKFHLLVDIPHEVVLAWSITSTKVGDNEELPDLLDQARANLPDGRIQTVAYDKAADDAAVHEILYDLGIKPLIKNRTLWKGEPERLLPGHDGNSNIVYDEAGTVYCYDKVSEPPVRRPMAYIGHEPERGTLKYRCPAMHEGFACPMASICNEGKAYGKTVRVKQEIDLRRFPAIPRATKQFERLYKGRTAVERVNGRMKIYWGADDGNVTGATRFHAYLSAVMIVHIGLATLLASTPRRDPTLGTMHLQPIVEALQKKLAEGKLDLLPVE
jgi:hypothetical protein